MDHSVLDRRNRESDGLQMARNEARVVKPEEARVCSVVGVCVETQFRRSMR